MGDNDGYLLERTPRVREGSDEGKGSSGMRVLEIFDCENPYEPVSPIFQMVLTDTGTLIPGSGLVDWIPGERERWKYKHGDLRYPTPEELFTHFLQFTNGGYTAAREVPQPWGMSPSSPITEAAARSDSSP